MCEKASSTSGRSSLTQALRKLAVNESIRHYSDQTSGTGRVREASKCTIHRVRQKESNMVKTTALIAIILLLTSAGLAGQEIKPPSRTPAPQTDKHRDLLRDAVR